MLKTNKSFYFFNFFMTLKAFNTHKIEFKKNNSNIEGKYRQQHKGLYDK